MTPGVMSDSAIVTHNEPGIKTDPSPNNAAAALNNNRSGKQREEATENGIRIKKEDEDEEDSKIMDMSVLAPALPHITQGFYPLSRLIGRMAQESHTMFYDLTEAIQHQRDMVRREAVLAHVMERRSQWIKILVLTMWAKRAKDVSTAIDLKVMLDQINDHYNMANYELFGLRRDLANAKYANTPRHIRGLSIITVL